MMDVAKAKAVAEYERQAANIINRSKVGELSAKQTQSLAGTSEISELKSLVDNDMWAMTSVGQKAIQKHWKDVESIFANR